MYRGTSLALVGVGNGAIQFMGYEQLKWICTEQKRKMFLRTGKTWTPDSEKLVRAVPIHFQATRAVFVFIADSHLFIFSALRLPTNGQQSNQTYTLISGASKLFALVVTYPYQVVRSRIQNNATAHLYPSIPACVARTWREEGARGFYRGLGTNLVRVLPGTCVTFVVYENLAWLFKSTARRREEAKGAADR